MKKFEFSKSDTASGQNSVFSGRLFYNVYKEAEFLRHSDHIETILSKGHELRIMLKNITPGDRVTLEGIWLEKNTPLLVRKTGTNVKVENFEFTSNRLSGLVAAYAFDNRHRFPVMKSSEALSLGLVWDNNDETKCRQFLSAVSGTEHFYEQFQYWPLVCALRKLQLKKITLEPVIKIAKIKNDNGVRMGQELMRNIATVSLLWRQFPGSSNNDLKAAFQTLPNELKKLLRAG